MLSALSWAKIRARGEGAPRAGMTAIFVRHPLLQLGLGSVYHAVGGIHHSYVLQRAGWNVPRDKVIQIQNVYFLVLAGGQVDCLCCQQT
jgi:hypothetical protein